MNDRLAKEIVAGLLKSLEIKWTVGTQGQSLGFPHSPTYLPLSTQRSLWSMIIEVELKCVIEIKVFIWYAGL